MKKLLFILCLASVLDVDARLTLDIYKDAKKYFPPEMDLVNGYIFDHEGALSELRFGKREPRFGGGESRFGKVEMSPNPENNEEMIYSAANTSDNPAARIAIALFPSPYSTTHDNYDPALDVEARNTLTSCFLGTLDTKARNTSTSCFLGTLDTEARNTLTSCLLETPEIGKVPDTMINFIVNMFHVANEVRTNPETYMTEISSYKDNTRPADTNALALIRKAFSMTDVKIKEILKEEKHRLYCANLICDIVGAVARESEKDEYYTNPNTNHLISAYAWYILRSKEDVTRLHDALNINADKKPDDNSTFRKANDKFLEENNGNPFPFLLGERPVTNGIQYIDINGSVLDSAGKPNLKQQYSGSDCNEIVVRHLFSLLLSNGDGEIDKGRLGCCQNKGLSAFFTEHNNARTLVIEGRQDIRREWLKVMEGLNNNLKLVVNNKEKEDKLEDEEKLKRDGLSGDIKYTYGGIQYEQYPQGFRLKTGWKNILKVICTLIKDYNDEQNSHSKDIKETIRTVLAWNDTIQVPPTAITNALNNILKIRAGVEFKAKAVGENDPKPPISTFATSLSSREYKAKKRDVWVKDKRFNYNKLLLNMPIHKAGNDVYGAITISCNGFAIDVDTGDDEISHSEFGILRKTDISSSSSSSGSSDK